MLLRLTGKESYKEEKTMKNKKYYIGLLAAVSIGCFFIGRNTVKVKTMNGKNDKQSTDYVYACEFVENIVDWNTDGTGLALSLSNGLEVYAYKTEKTDVYKGNRIISVSETDNGKVATKKNGKQYFVKPITEEEKVNE